MLQKRHLTSLPDQPNPPSRTYTQEESINFECGREIIGQMIGICTDKIRLEELKEHPDQKILDELDKQQFYLTLERKNLRWYEQEKIRKIRQTYGAEIRAYRKNQDDHL